MTKTEDIKAARVKQLMNEMGHRFIYFKGGNLMSGPGTHGFKPFDSRLFGALAQEQVFGTSESAVRDMAQTVKTLSPDWSHLDHYIAFGERVWDTSTLSWSDTQLDYVYSSPITPSDNTALAMRFLVQLAKGDEDLARDYLQSLAPLFMDKKPAGVIWFVGDGANGKSSLIDAVYRLMGGHHLASMTTSAIEDGKATPVLMGILGNIVREASEARVEDTERYKAIGTHEPFDVRQLYTQENITVQTNFHTVFNANNVPVFSDKTKGARRRTLVLPFKAHFADNPLFDDQTFTPEFLGGLLTLLLEETHTIRDNKYRYKWSDATLQAKEAYDSEVNSVEAFVAHLRDTKVVGFTNFASLRLNYENWCSLNGMVSLGITTLKRTVVADTGAARMAYRSANGAVAHHYFFSEVYGKDLIWLDNGYGIESNPTIKVNERISSEW